MTDSDVALARQPAESPGQSDDPVVIAYWPPVCAGAHGIDGFHASILGPMSMS